jgi:glycosyltransferase involved in cell wall biosynthesis
MSTQPLVSVIIPAYNAESYIGQALESALCQTYGNLEFIVVDDGSQDNTAGVVADIARRDKRVKLLQQTNGGVAKARNLAIKNSSGEYVAPLDADDIWFPEKIERQVQSMEDGGPSVGLVYASSVHVDEHSGALVGADPLWHVEGNVFQTLIYINFTGNASVPLIRRACFQQVGGYNIWLKEQGAQGCEDWDLLLRIAEHYEFRAVRDYLVRYRAVANSMSRNSMAMGKSYALIMESLKRRHPEIPEKVWRWSKSYFCAYLMGTIYNANPRQSLHWGRQALKADPVVIFVPWFRTMLIKSVFWRVADAFRVPFFGDRLALRQLRKSAMERLGLKELKERNLSEFTGRYRENPHPWNPLKLYDRICIHRFQQTIQYGKMLTQQQIHGKGTAVGHSPD